MLARLRPMARIIGFLLLALLVGLADAEAVPPPERLAVLRRGVNLTNWFRYPPNADISALRGYLTDHAVTALTRAGFTFVRLAVQPDLLERSGGGLDPAHVAALTDSVLRLERQGLGVIVEAHADGWHLEHEPADRSRLLAFWRVVGAALRPMDPRVTFPEIVNEPVFSEDPEGWAAFQQDVLRTIREPLPNSTVILTGSDWGSLNGLLRLRPVADANVAYSFHFYEPMTLTTLAAWRPGADRDALARLPFPVSSSCEGQPEARAYCDQRWDKARIRARVALAGEWARLNHAAVIAGEFGASARLNAPARLAWLTAAREAFEAQSISWALWGLEDVHGFDVPRPPRDPFILDQALLRALGL